MESVKIKKNNNYKLVRQVFLSVLPMQIMLEISFYLHSILDSIFVGRFLGENNLAIIGLATPISLAITLIGGVMFTGALVVCGKTIGCGDKEGTHSSFTNTITLSLILGVFTMLLCRVLSNKIPTLLGVTDSQIAKDFSSYLNGICISFPFVIFFKAQLSFLELDRAKSFALTSTFVMVISKILLDLLSIFVFKNGMFGIGLATSLAYVIAVAVGFVGILLKCKSFRFVIKSISLKTFGKLIVQGFPGGIQTLSSVIITSLFNTLAMRYGGPQGVSILTATINTTEFLFAFINGVYSTAAVLISVYSGSRDRKSIKSVCVVAIRVNILLALLCILLIFPISRPMAVLFGLGSGSVPIASRAMRIVIFGGLVCWGKVMNLSAYKSMGLVKRSCVYCIVGLMAIPCISCYILSLFLGLDGIWFNYIISDAISSLVFFGYSALKLGRIPRSMKEWIFIPKEFGINSDSRLDISISDINEITLVSEKIIEFCKLKGIDSRRSYYSGLCVEEMTANIFKHNGSRANLTADVRVVDEKGDLYITIRDNGKSFNPSEYLKLTHGSDPTENIGIKLVSSIAKDIRYSAPLGFNLLTINL